MKPLPKKLNERHKGLRVQIAETARPTILRRCRHEQGYYTGAGGNWISNPDQVFYQSGVIVSIGGTDKSRCLVAWPDEHSNTGLWLDIDELVSA